MDFNSLSKASKVLMFEEPFYGIFLIGLNKEFNELIPTACVSKRGIDCQLTINPKFWDSMDEKSKIGVLKHEILHICFGHLFLQDILPDHSLLNIAADLEVNQYINDSQKGPKWHELKPIEISNYPELNLPKKAGTIKYYELLKPILEKRKQQQGQGQGQDEQDQSQGGGGTNQNKGQQGQGKGQQNPNQGGGTNQNKGQSGDPQTNSDIWKYYDDPEANQHSNHKLWKEFYDGLGEAEKKLVKKQVEHTLKKLAEETKRGRGTIPSEMTELINSLFVVEEPVIDWKAYLRRFAGNSNKIYTKKSRHKVNKRFTDNPALKIKLKKHILVARDTSGSTSQGDHIEFFNELHHMYKAGVKITIIDADAGVADCFEYKGTPPDHLSGRGGTDFDPAIEFYNEHHRNYDAFIYLTDGECPAPRLKPRTTMLWVISSRGTLSYSKDYPGKVVQITG